jgi:uncharacterized protein (TIGR02300 family)
MPKEEWGVKRVCPKCATRFYDLQNDPMTCPACEESFDVASLTQQKTRASTPEKEAKVEEPATVDDLEDAVVLDDDEDTADDIGDDLLDDDDDDATVTLDEIADVSNEDTES